MKLKFPSFGILNDEDILNIHEYFIVKNFAKGSCILKTDWIDNSIYYLNTGLVYSIDDYEKINWYEFEGEFFFDIDSYYGKKKSKNKIVAAEDSQVIVISRDKIDLLCKNDHKWCLWYSKFLEQLLFKINFYYTSLIEKDATTRYNELIDFNPDILNRIPLGHIASYLNITQVSLSRIRAKKQKKK